MAGLKSSKESPIIVWLDANVFSEENKALQAKLNEKHSTVMVFTDLDECERYIQRSSIDLKVIVSGAFGKTLVCKIEQFDQVFAIYVYCGDVTRHKQWSKDHDKVNLVTNKPEELLSRL